MNITTAPTINDTARLIKEAFARNADALGLEGEARTAHVNALAGKLINLVDVFSRPDTPAPVELRSVRQSFPEPADFQREIVLGQIHGEPVRGLQSWDTVSGTIARYVVECNLAGLLVTCDAENVELDTYRDAEGMPLRSVAALAELWQSGAIEQLVQHARRWCASEAVQQRKAA